MNFIDYQEYKERKRQKLQKRILDQLKVGVEKSQSSQPSVSSNLTRLLETMKERSGGKVKGSRFTHTEKLQFAQVRVLILVDNLHM